MIQQHPGNGKAAPGLLLLQVVQEILSQRAGAVCDENHISVLKALLLHQPEGLLKRRFVIGVAIQKGLGCFQHILPVKLSRKEKVGLKAPGTGEVDHGETPFPLNGNIQQGQRHRLAPWGRILGGAGFIQHTDDVAAALADWLPALVLFQPLALELSQKERQGLRRGQHRELRAERPVDVAAQLHAVLFAPAIGIAAFALALDQLLQPSKIAGGLHQDFVPASSPG